MKSQSVLEITTSCGRVNPSLSRPNFLGRLLGFGYMLPSLSLVLCFPLRIRDLDAHSLRWIVTLNDMNLAETAWYIAYEAGAGVAALAVVAAVCSDTWMILSL